MREKVILVDCDGVLLDWEYAFDVWMRRHGHKSVENGFDIYNVDKRYNIHNGKQLIRMFNESAAIGFLPPLRDAMYYVKLLHERHGYVFHAITSLSNDPAAQELRTRNLKRLFGKTAFERFVYLDTGAPKYEALKPYAGTNCYWIEDKYLNADVGFELGLDPILVAHNHNVEYDGPALRLESWGDIYREIISE